MKKLTMLYDATVVCNILTKNSSRSGIFFVAYNVLLELLKREEFNIFLYGDNIVKLQNVIENYDELAKCKRYRFSFLDDIIIFLSNLKKKNKKKLFYIFLSILLSLFISVLKKINKFYINNFKIFDDIDVYFSPMKAVPKFIFKFKSIKRFTILHDTIPLVNDYRNNAEKHDWYHKLISTINSTDNYFANSLSTKQDFIEYVPKINPSNICVIPLSTGKPYFKIGDEYYIKQIKRKYSIPTDKKYIFSLCNLDPRKNLIFAIKNFFNFIEKHNLDDFIFVLGGSHFKDFEDILNKNIENLGDKKNKILRIGYVDDEDMSALYSGAEMFVFPSLYEGFGIPVLEAMKCGLPVICSNTTSLPEVIGDCGIQINPYSDKALIEAMEKMYFDREFRQECIKKGLERAKLFTWKKCADIITNTITAEVDYEKENNDNFINL